MRRFLLLFYTLLCLTSMALCQQNDFNWSKIDPELKKDIESSTKSDEMFRILVVMEEQYDQNEMENLTRDMDNETAREFVIEKLKRFAMDKQANVSSIMRSQKTNTVKNLQFFWILNGFVCEATADVISFVSKLNDIKIIYSDKERIMNFEEAASEPIQPLDRETIWWSLNTVNAPDVWSYNGNGYTGRGVIVAILDTGVNYNHNDIVENMWNGGSSYPYHGWDFANNDNDPMDDEGHGSHCAGIVAGHTTYTYGYHTGVAPGATIMALKVFKGDGSYLKSNVKTAMQFALDHGAKVLSMSFGENVGGEYDYRIMMENLKTARVIAAVAAGNEGDYVGLIPNDICSPGNCPPPYIHPDQTLVGGTSATICVGATDENDERYHSSSIGPSTWATGDSIGSYNDYPYSATEMGLIKPDVMAPGYNILSITHNNNDGYCVKHGTSMATPCVAGVIALMLEADRHLTPADIDRILETTAVKCGGETHKNNNTGSGRVDALAAINAVLGNCSAPTNLSATVNSNNVTLTWTAAEGVESYRIYRDDVMIESAVTGTSYTDSSLALGDYTYYLKSNCSDESTSVASNTVIAEVDFPGSITATIGNLQYSLNTQKHVAQVIGPKSGYNSGDLVIPSSVTYNNVTYTVTSIGYRAFYLCDGFTGSLTIPNSVVSIGNDAFCGCTGLTGSLTIPNSVTLIGDNAFNHCSGFAGSLTMGESVTIIGKRAFYYCSGFTTLTIGNSVTTIGEYAFTNCSGLTTVNWDAVNVVDYPEDSYCPFRGCTNFTVIFGNQVQSIPTYAFYNCSGLTSLTLGNSVTTIGNGVFSGCSGLTGSLTIPNSVTTIGYEAFEDCSGLTVLTIGNSVTTIGYSAFRGCSGLTALTIGNSVTTIGEYAFGGCSGLTGSLTIPNSVTTIGNSAFTNCSGLTTVNWDAVNVVDYPEDFYCPFRGCTNFTVIFGNQVQSIPAYAFYGCSGLTGSLTIPNSVTTIGYEAFEDCSGLTVLTIGNSVTTIGYSAFRGCSGLTVLTIGNSVTTIGYAAFYGCSGLTTVNWNAVNITDYVCPFGGCTNLTVVFGNQVQVIPAEAFKDFSGLKALTIGNSVTTIGNEAFSGCQGLNGSLTIPNSVTSIGSDAFYNCSVLTELTIGNSVTTIGNEAFSGCQGLNGSLTIPNSVTSIGEYAFRGCSGLTALTIGNSVTTIEDWAFCGCSGLTGSLTIPNSVTTIGNGAFSGCSGLSGSLTIPNSVTIIGNSAFYECGGFNGSLTLGNSVTSIGDWAFYGCNGFTGSLIIGDSVISIGDYVFYTCSGFTSLTIGVSVESIGELAFCRCGGLMGALVIPGSVTNIGDYAFSSCISFNSIRINGINPPIIYGDTFYNINKSIPICVPCGSLSTYQTAQYWSAFENIRETEYVLVVTQNDEYGGKVSILEMADCEDNHCSILATPSIGYTFNGWYVDDECAAGSELYNFSLTEDVTYEARFTRNENHYIANGTSNTWSNPDTWDTGNVPTETSTVAIYKNIVVDVDANVSAMGVYDDNTITITPDVVLTIEDELVSDNVSSIVIEDGGQIIHSNEDVMATVEKTIEPFTSDDDGWNLVSFPLIDNGTVASVANMLSNEYDLYAYDEPSYTWINQKDDNNDFTELEAGKGYLYANSGTGFVYSFEDGLDGWTTIDADGDGYNWYLASYGGYSGYKCVKSASWVSGVGALTPDNFIVSPQLGFTSMSKVAFWVCADDANYAAEHFGLAVSTTSNDNPSDYTIIEEWTLTAKSILYAGAWYKFTVDLSQYAGQSGYLALRHFNCYDQYVLKLDEFCLWGFDNLVSQNMTMSFAGEIENGTAEITVPLSYTSGNKLSGFNLVGNPFVHNVTSYDGYNVADGCYRINDAKTNLIVSTISNENPLKVGEGFFVKATGDNASITFNSPIRKGIDERGFVRMELIENDKVIDRLIVKKDGEQLKKMSLRGSHTELFARNNSERLSIVPMQGAEQPVSFKAVRMGSYTITVDIEYLDVDYLHLIDNFTGKDVDLLIEPQYTFVGASDDSENRFRLVFDKSANVNNSEIFAYQNGNEIIVSGNGTLQVFDVMGRMVAIQQINGVGRWRTTSETGVYIFKLNGKTQKIVMR